MSQPKKESEPGGINQPTSPLYPAPRGGERVKASRNRKEPAADTEGEGRPRLLRTLHPVKLSAIATTERGRQVRPHPRGNPVMDNALKPSRFAAQLAVILDDN